MERWSETASLRASVPGYTWAAAARSEDCAGLIMLVKNTGKQLRALQVGWFRMSISDPDTGPHMPPSPLRAIMRSLQDYEARVAYLEALVARQALEIERLRSLVGDAEDL